MLLFTNNHVSLISKHGKHNLNINNSAESVCFASTILQYAATSTTLLWLENWPYKLTRDSGAEKNAYHSLNLGHAGALAKFDSWSQSRTLFPSDKQGEEACS